jgi:hypothetical protein
VKVKRFYFVASRRSRIAHMARSIAEGSRTYCGARIWKGWGWARDAAARKHAGKRTCKRCLNSMGKN